jgi:hypothetical protein
VLSVVSCMIAMSTRLAISSSVRDIERLLRESLALEGGEDVKTSPSSSLGCWG